MFNPPPRVDMGCGASCGSTKKATSAAVNKEKASTTSTDINKEEEKQALLRDELQVGQTKDGDVDGKAVAQDDRAHQDQDHSKEQLQQGERAEGIAGELPPSSNLDKVSNREDQEEEEEDEKDASSSKKEEQTKEEEQTREEEKEEEEKEELPPPTASWLEAAQLGEVSALSWYLRHSRAKVDEDVEKLLGEKEQEKGRTALHLAAENGRSEAVSLLLQAKADPFQQDKCRAYPLHSAASAGHFEVCRLLLNPSGIFSDDQPKWPDTSCLDVWRQSPLHKAAAFGGVEVVQLLMKEKAKVDSADREGNTALHKAAESGHAGVVKVLVAKSTASLSEANRDGLSPLDLCLLHHHTAAGDFLVDLGSTLQRDIRKNPPTLLQAVEKDLPSLVYYIFKQGSAQRAPNTLEKQLKEKDENGRTPLLKAASEGRVEVFRRLWENVSSPTALGNMPSKTATPSTEALSKIASSSDLGLPDGELVLHEAISKGHSEIFEIVVESCPTAVGWLEGRGRTPLFSACFYGYPELLQRLLVLKSDPKATDFTEETPLHAAAAGGHVAVMKLLLEAYQIQVAGTNSSVLEAEDWEGATPAHFSVREGHVEVCEYLASRNADFQKALDFNVTPLQVACERGHTGVLRFLIDLMENLGGRDLLRESLQSSKSSDGRTPFLTACAQGHLDSCKVLASRSEDERFLLEQVDRDKRSALHLASKLGKAELCEWILSSKAFTTAYLQARDSCDWTPLLVSAASGSKEVVRCLLERKADVTVVDDEGHTARDLAKLKGHAMVEQLLKKAEETQL